MNTVLEYINKIPKKLLPTVAFLLVIGIGYLDYITGFEFEISIFYLLPLLLVVWFGKKLHAVFLSIFSAIVWLFADMTSGHIVSHSVILAWNAFTLWGFFLIIILSMSEIKALLENERLSARIDFVTGALNRRAFHEIAEIEVMRAGRHMRPVTLAYIDVDNFKLVNDTLGHSVGDSVLRSVSETMKHHIRSSDIVARLGGDEFVILMPETDGDNAKQAVSKVHNNLLDAVQQNNWPVSFSIGVVSCYKSCNVDELIKMADALMYSVKNSGKNRVAYQAI